MQVGTFSRQMVIYMYTRQTIIWLTLKHYIYYSVNLKDNYNRYVSYLVLIRYRRYIYLYMYMSSSCRPFQQSLLNQKELKCHTALDRCFFYFFLYYYSISNSIAYIFLEKSVLEKGDPPMKLTNRPTIILGFPVLHPCWPST